MNDRHNILRSRKQMRSPLKLLALLLVSLIARGSAMAAEPQPGIGGARFSLERGFYAAPIEVEIKAPIPGAQICFTTNGSVPSEASGRRYTRLIKIHSTTVLRAAAFQAGSILGGVDTETYIFPKEVRRQSGRVSRKPGVPTKGKRSRRTTSSRRKLSTIPHTARV